MTNPTLFILGADDPEMREIERILIWDKRQFQYAMKDGKRVHPGNAYEADRVEFPGDVVLIECQPISIHVDGKVFVIDHHRPGDPGYNASPKDFWYVIDHHRPGDPGYGASCKDFWHASSLGQLADFLGIGMEVGSHANVVLAAMDHCPAAAIRGECPGVSAQEVVDRKVAEIAKASKYSEDEVRGRIESFQLWAVDAPTLAIGGQSLVDLRDTDTGEGYSLDYLSAQVAALAGGYAVLLLTHDRGDSRPKWTVAGHATPAVIEAFKNEWAPAQGLVGIYGVPSRGYAGGYLPS